MSSTNGMPPELPNPYTPLAFFPPAVAHEIPILIYTLVASLAVMIWDMLNNVNAEYRLLTQHRIVLPTITYFISRFATLGYLLTSTIILTAPIGHCVQVWKGISWFYAIAVPATSLLFLFRVRGMYNKDIYITLFFSFMWLSVVAGSVTTAQGLTVIPLGTTNYCTNGKSGKYVISSGIILLVNDTLVFIAITWRLIHNSRPEATRTSGIWSFISGKHLMAFSRSLLRDGQMYYLSTVGLCFISVALCNISSLPGVYRSAVGIPDIMLINVMACRVYRNTKCGTFRETISDIVLPILPTGGPETSIVFRAGNSSMESVTSGELDDVVERGLRSGIL